MDDPHDLERFVLAQRGIYGEALGEVTAGRKRSHWMWFIFPQVEGLAFSAMSRRYAIKDAGEARAYLAHPVLGPRLTVCAEAVLLHAGRSSATEIFGQPDDLKLRSSATLFAHVSPADSAFHRLLEQFYPGGPDAETIQRLELLE